MVQLAQCQQHRGFIDLRLLLRHRRPGQCLGKDSLHLLRCSGGVGRHIKGLVRHPAAHRMEVFCPTAQGGDHIVHRMNFHTRCGSQSVHIVRKVRCLNMQCLIRAESGQHLAVKVRQGRDLLVIRQVVRRVVGGAQHFDLALFNQCAGAKIPGSDGRIGAVVDVICRGGRQRGINAKIHLQFHMRPVIQRVADGVLQGVGKFLKLLSGAGVAGAVPLVHTAGAHGPPLIMIAGQPQGGNIRRLGVLIDLLGT